MHKVHAVGLSKTEKCALWDGIIAHYLASGRSLKTYSQQEELNYEHLSYYVSAYKRKQAKQFFEVDLSTAREVAPQVLLIIELDRCRLLLLLNMFRRKR